MSGGGGTQRRLALEEEEEEEVLPARHQPAPPPSATLRSDARTRFSLISPSKDGERWIRLRGSLFQKAIEMFDPIYPPSAR